MTGWMGLLWAGFALWSLGCVGGTSEPSAPGEKEPIVVGAIFDLTGATSDVGVTYADGMKDHISWRNAQGGIQGHRIVLRSADYGYRVDRAESLYTKYINDGAVVFLGWGTGDTEALRGRIARDKVPFMSASYSAGLLNMEEAPYNFLVGTSYSDQAIIGLRWAAEDHKAKGAEGPTKAVIMHHDSPFGKSPLADATAYAKQAGIELTTIVMPKGATDYVAELARVQQAGANYVVIHNTAGPASVLVKDAKTQGLDDLTFVGLVWVADEIFVNLAGEAAEGVVGAMPFAIPTPELPGSKDPEAFLSAKGSSLKEKGVHYTQGWWTVGVMLEGVERALASGEPLTGERVKAALETLEDFSTGGITAPVTFSAQSHRGNAELRMHRVKNGGWEPIGELISATSGG